MTDLMSRFVFQRWRSKFTNYPPVNVGMPTLATIIAGAYCLLALLSLPLPVSDDHDAMDLKPADGSSVPADSGADYAEMAAWHLLAASGEPTNAMDQELNATQLQLTLLGTWLLSEREQDRYAVIQTADGSQRRYRVGDEIVDGARLQAVEARRVIIRRGEVDEYLAFQPNPLSLSASD